MASAAPTPLQLTLPAPTGREPIGTVSLHLVDPSRHDDWVPGQPVRELMVQLWYPAADTENYPVAPWMSPGAEKHFLTQYGLSTDQIRLPVTHGHVGAPAQRRAWPVVLYSHGSHDDRSGGTAEVEDLVSHGYVVVTIDHTHYANEVEFPDGRVVPEVHDSDVPRQVAMRSTDTSFVLDQLRTIAGGGDPDAEHRPLPRGLGAALDLHDVGMFGHSFGGLTTAQAMHDDPRILAGVDFDGPFFGGTAATEGVTGPFLVLGSRTHDWRELLPLLHGWHRDLQVGGSAHQSLSDWEFLITQAQPVLKWTPEQLDQAIGTIDPAQALKIGRTYLRAFFDLHLRGRCTRLFDGPTPRFPEVQFIN
ncbi:hydrolase [Solihabitans fulvus]|uniref:Hydrolase n=2 Tax=Solihabitans fulvus TaxID=1892852 RepID=A0A5B2WTU0_9PSEU|nr:hydrolase [Solihabitans fulvus]